MASHKLKNYRFRIIDSCLKDNSKKWTLQELIDEVSTKLYSEFGVKKVSKRTIQYDIALMRQEPPIGFNAPILCVEGSYFYSEDEFSIHKSQLSKPDIDSLKEAAQILKQYKDYSHIGGIHKIVEKIESIASINPGPGSDTIIYEKQSLSNLNKAWITKIHESILHQQVLEITIENKKNKNYESKIVHPYILREYSNNWYLYGFDESINQIGVFDLSHIGAISPKIITFKENTYFDTSEYFDKLIGIHPAENINVQTVKLWIRKDILSMIHDNPIHASQEIVDENDAGATLNLKVFINKDLEELLLSLGKNVKIEAPETLRKKVISQLKEAYEAYFRLSLF
ncbi:MAG: WYL domain-containing protein [Bacteroidales bacterium]|nr:WYL domain-containing protein [Bacteroidales bacterium]